jgi:hypothetical protein
MSRIPSNLGVFYGQFDKRSKGWYWTDTVKCQKQQSPVRSRRRNKPLKMPSSA